VAAAQQLAGGASDGSGGDAITIGVLGASVSAAAGELAAAAVSQVLVAEHPALDPYTPDAHIAACRALIESTSPAIVLLPHTYQTRDFAPLLAARVRSPLVTDVTGITGTGADATFTRPMFQGKLAAQVKPLGAALAIVTMQIGAIRADSARWAAPRRRAA
jgi:electron transfer flavoprotein alpha subunit